MQCRSAFADTNTELWIVLVAIDASPIKINVLLSDCYYPVRRYYCHTNYYSNKGIYCSLLFCTELTISPFDVFPKLV